VQYDHIDAFVHALRASQGAWATPPRTPARAAA
jgi:hypothetical protein